MSPSAEPSRAAAVSFEDQSEASLYPLTLRTYIPEDAKATEIAMEKDALYGKWFDNKGNLGIVAIDWETGNLLRQEDIVSGEAVEGIPARLQTPDVQKRSGIITHLGKTCSISFTYDDMVVTFTPQYTRAAFFAEDQRSLAVVQLSTGEIVAEQTGIVVPSFSETFSCTAISPVDERHFCVLLLNDKQENLTALLDSETNTFVYATEGVYSAVAWDEERIVLRPDIGNIAGNNALLYHVPSASAEPLESIPAGTEAMTVRFSEDGTHAVTISNTNAGVCVTVYDTSAFTVTGSLEIAREEAHIDPTMNGELIQVSNDGSVVSIVDTKWVAAIYAIT